MSLTADTADAIIAVDKALAAFERTRIGVIADEESPAYSALKDAIEGLMVTSLGEGMHFDSLEEARAFRAPKPPRDPNAGCYGVHAGELCNTSEAFTRWHNRNH